MYLTRLTDRPSPAFAEAVRAHATAHGLRATVAGDCGTVRVILRACPDALFDLTVAAIRREDVPADFAEHPAPTGPGSVHHTWATASAAAYNRHRLGYDLGRHREAIGALAAAHHVENVIVEAERLEAADVLVPLLEVKTAGPPRRPTSAGPSISPVSTA